MHISFSQVNVKKKLSRGFPGHSFRARDTNSKGREATCVQVTLPLWGNCAPQRLSIAFLNTSFTRYFTDMSKSLPHCPYRNVGPQRLAPSALTNLAKCWQKF